MTAQAQPDDQPLIVLDLGCHDGYIGAWLKQQTSVTVYGVELHPQGVAEAIRRGYADARQGNALDAPLIFPELAGRCDAVVLFELIEHVPDPEHLLIIAETMLRPGGRVYVSTPDGCFGDGGNPHHLRALRAQDLADLLRRRGRLTDMSVGEDTITVAAYQPADRIGEATIYTGPCWSRWSPTDIDARGLGGSETAAVNVARELSDAGWVVTVYGDVEACCFRDVIYKHYATFDPLAPVDLLISSRYPEVFERPVRARTRLLWVHDVDCGDRLTPETTARVDGVLALSQWHARHLAGRYPFVRPKIVQTRNGINVDRFTGDVEDRRPRVLYTSSPDRGLDVLLELWPAIRDQAAKKGVDAVLEACYSPVYWRIAEQDPGVAAHAERVRALADQPGVTLLPSQGQAALARLMRESRVWVAPSFHTPTNAPFHETSCIGAMEAQAAGLHVVASNWGALPETVRVGALVDGPPLSPRWRRAMIAEIVRGLTNRVVQAHAQDAGPAHARSLGWAGVAEQITALTAVGAAG